MSWECLLFGGYAGGTVGDEIALAVALSHCREIYGPNIAILSRDPPYTASLFPGLEIVPYLPQRQPAPWSPRLAAIGRRLGLRPSPEGYRPRDQLMAPNPLPWVEALRSTKRLYLVGGGYLNDVWELSFTLLPIRLAHEFGVPIETAPLQLGPLYSRRSRQDLARILKDSGLRIRDATSMRLAGELGLAVEGATDDVFQVLDVVEAGTARSRGQLPLLGVCTFRQNRAPQPQFDDWWVAFLRHLRTFEKRISVEGFAFHNYAGYDNADAKELFGRAGWDPSLVQAPPVEFRGAVANLARYDAVITCRFHAAVVAAALDLPCFAFASGDYYSAKLTAFWPQAARPIVPIAPEAVSPLEAANELVEHACRKV